MYRCPQFTNADQCDGKLKLLNESSTIVGMLNGVDSNNYTETFKCNKCSIIVSKNWTWKLIAPAGSRMNKTLTKYNSENKN